MADQLPSPAELRTQARHHREAALQVADPKARTMHLTVAEEFEKLAAAVEAELAETRKRPA
ncbi:MAG: hypothetical protein JO128_20100 [Alphaproteobacteria bacterium]|nr:hypothetical protein [Alphaproteobacteria bacterium]